jgi:hypothetical protein
MTATIDQFYSASTPPERRLLSRCIYRWSRDLPALREAAAQTRNRSLYRVRAMGIATVLSTNAERELVTWLNLLRKDGVPVSGAMLSAKARELAVRDGIAPESFSASHVWRRSFLKRHRLSIRARTRHGQTTPAEAMEVLAQFALDVARVAQENAVEMIYNADQTGVWLEYLPRTTVNDRGAKTVWVKSSGREKERITAMLLGDASGTKYAPFLVQVDDSSCRFGERSRASRFRHSSVETD